MLQTCLAGATRLAALPTARAYGVGLLMGAMVSRMAHERADGFGLAMALLLVVSGALSMVCHGLSLLPEHSAALQGRLARRWLIMIGGGMLTAFYGLMPLVG